MIRLGSFKIVSFQNSSWGIFCSLGGSALGLAPTQKCGVKVMSFICKTAHSTGFCSVPLISGVFSMLTLKEKSCHEVFNGEGEISSQVLAKNLKGLRNSGPKELDSNNPMKKISSFTDKTWTDCSFCMHLQCNIPRNDEQAASVALGFLYMELGGKKLFSFLRFFLFYDIIIYLHHFLLSLLPALKTL